MHEPLRIALFGGTFDPVHDGHLQLAKRAMEALTLDQVRFLPCRISPHKTGTVPTSADSRLHMLRLATRDLPWAVVDDYEIGLEGPSFSYRTAEEMVKRLPGARLFWIMGCDQWEALPHWAHPERLAACVEFIVFARDRLPSSREGYRFHRVDGIHPASATAIRASIANGAKPKWLDPLVAAWIAKHDIYQKFTS